MAGFQLSCFTQQHDFKKKNLFLRRSLIYFTNVGKIGILNCALKTICIQFSAIRGRCSTYLKSHYWPNDLADKHTLQQLNVQDRLKTNISWTHFQRVGRDLGSPQPTFLAGRLWGEIAWGPNKRLSEKSSRCATVNCQALLWGRGTSFACW